MRVAEDVWEKALSKSSSVYADGWMTGVEDPFLNSVTFSIAHCMEECEESNKTGDRKEHGNSEDPISENPIQSVMSGRTKGPSQSEEAMKPICAHLLRLVALIRSAGRSKEIGQTFVIRGQRHVEVPGSAK